MPVILKRMNAGIPGDVTRKENAVIEPNIAGADIACGSFVKLSSGKVIPLAASDTAAVIYGLAVRMYPSQSESEDFGGGVISAGTVCDVLRSGYMNVVLKQGTAARGGQVYVRVTADEDAKKNVGDIEAAADTTKTVAVTGCMFMGAADENGNTEIAYNI